VTPPSSTGQLTAICIPTLREFIQNAGPGKQFRKLRISPLERIETGRNTGIHQNPKRERGILGQNDPNAKNLNPSLTFRVGISANAQLQQA
jgi:hypothetical protein